MRCWYTRWQLSNALDRSALGEGARTGDLPSLLTRGHAARCAACQAFGRQLTALHAGLSRDAAMAPLPRPVVRRARAPAIFHLPEI